MDKAEIERVKQSVDIAAFINQFIRLEQDGKHWKACCPFHQEKTPSFVVTPGKGIFKCFGCGAEGDAIAFVQQYKGLDFKDALAEVQQFSGIGPGPAPKEKEKNFKVLPVPKGARPPGFFQDEQAEKHFPYTDQQGNILGYGARFKNPKFKNLYILYVQYEDGRTAWKYTRFSKPYPLYNLHQLAHSPKAQVMIVEGEKCADALNWVLQGALVVMAWPGGSNGVRYTDWTPLHGRKVVIWPDNDDPGAKAMNEILGQLAGKADLRCMAIPDDKPKGWDCADAVDLEGWDKARIVEFIKSTLYKPAEPARQQDEAPAEPPPEPSENGGRPFQCLGHDHGTYFYLARGSRQVMPIRVSDHKSHLLGLAPLQYWETYHAGRNGPDWNGAINSLLRDCEAQGVYNMQSVRGRGAWYDAGRSVLHFGDHLLADGKPVSILDFNSKFVYEAGIEVKHNIGSPLINDEATRLIRLIKMFNWKKPIHADLLAGWVVLAPICGAVPWRPHIWLTGGAGTGKTYTVKNIIEPCLGEFRLYVQGNTTEAGLRQTLKNDAMPILFDESEGEDQIAVKRIKAVLDLMKQASSDTGGNILKGTQTGRAMMFQIRSMFCMSSVGLSIADEAARGRISILELTIPNKSVIEKREHFEALNKKIIEIVTDKYCADLRARTIKLIPVIRENIKVFNKAAANVFKKQRTADQYGTLLAGTYSLYDENIVTYDQAVKFVGSQDWDDVETDDNDSIECLNTILQTTVRLGDSNSEKSIAELLEAIRHGGGITGTEESNTLARHGIRLVDNYIWISDSHRSIRRIMADTRWPKMWNRILRRLDGAEVKKSMRFPGYPTSATGIPWDTIFSGDSVIQEEMDF